jgi:membrane protein
MSRIRRINDFLRYDIWRLTSAEYGSRKTKLAYQAIRTILLVIRGFGDKRLGDKAKSLTYSLIFTIIPILAMVLAVAKGFGVQDIIERQLNASFLGGTNIVPVIMEMVERYLDTAQGGVFIGVGILILLWAVYSFFSSVESAFKQIWNVQKSRSLVHQALAYIAILFLIPILIIVSSGVSIALHAVLADFHTGEPGPMHEALHSGGLRLLQFAICWLLFTLMYAAIPNTKVKFLSALIPGVLMGTIFQLLQMLSVYIIVFLSRTSIVYGAFASVPILLTWLQWTCLLIMLGAEMSFAIQNNENFEYEHDLEKMSRRYKDYITLYLLSVIIRRFEHEQPPLTAHELATGDHLPLRLVNQLLSRLVETGLISELYNEQDQERRYQPALDTHLITVGMVTDRIDAQGTEDFLSGTGKSMRDFQKRLFEIKKTHTQLNSVYVNQI